VGLPGLFLFFGGYIMAYTPSCSLQSSVTLRRLAWAFDLPMTKTIDQAVSLLPLIILPTLVCEKCRDNTRCGSCAFHASAIPNELL
jgi:hypothetical protein